MPEQGFPAFRIQDAIQFGRVIWIRVSLVKLSLCQSAS